MTADLRTALSRLLRAAKNANTWSNRINGCDAVPQRVLATAAQALEAANRAPAPDVDGVLDRLDEIARGVCSYDYGLPLVHKDACDAGRSAHVADLTSL